MNTMTIFRDQTYFFIFIFVVFLTSKNRVKKLLSRPKRALGANLIIFGLQLGSQNPPKIHFFPPQDVSYLKIREKPKFCESSMDLQHFSSPRAYQNPPKFYEKSILRVFSLETLF